jgi:hypothetical protein
MKVPRLALVASALLLQISSASAEMFRCGNVYQDHPCEDAKAGKKLQGVGTGGKPAPSPASGQAANPICVQRGADSLKIVWGREAGLTEDKATAAESHPDRKQLVADVYRVRGTAPEVRTRIEAECMAEMEERAKVLALHKAMVKAGVAPAMQSRGVAPTAEQSAEREAAEEKARATERSLAASEKKKESCDRLSSKLESNRQQQRSGGTGAEMNNLNRERSELEAEFRKRTCG